MQTLEIVLALLNDLLDMAKIEDVVGRSARRDHSTDIRRLLQLTARQPPRRALQK